MTIWMCLWRLLSKLVREDTDCVQTSGKMHKTKCFFTTKKLRIFSKSRFSLGFYSCWVYLFYVFFIIWIALMQRHHFNAFRTKPLPLPFMTGLHLWRKKVHHSTTCRSLQHLLLGAVRLVSSNTSLPSFNPWPVAESEINKSLITASAGWDVNQPLSFCLILSVSFHQHSVLSEYKALIKLVVSLPDIIMIHIQLSFSRAGSNTPY